MIMKVWCVEDDDVSGILRYIRLIPLILKQKDFWMQ